MWHAVSTTLDVENKFLDMVRGSYKQGAYLPLQMRFDRPNELCSGYPDVGKEPLSLWDKYSSLWHGNLGAGL